MSKIFAVTNQKGGVGKTTTAVNLAAALVLAAQKVLLVDLDPQGNATMGSGLDKHSIAPNLYHVLLGAESIKRACHQSPEARYSVLPSNQHLAGAEIELVDMPKREQRLKTALKEIQTEYDFILIDCPPALNLLTINGLTAANAVLIPMQCEYYALEGLRDLVATIKKVKVDLNPNLEIEGLVRTMYDARNALTQQVSDELEAHFGEKVYRTVIPRNVRLAEAPSFGVPGLVFDPYAKGSVAYLELAQEVLMKER